MEDIPDAVLQDILSRLDIPSFCSAASSCRLLWLSACQAIPRLEKLHLLELAPRNDELKRFLCHNSKVRSLKLDCGHLDDQALSFITKPHLEEIQLLNCDWFSARLLSDIGHCCSSLRSLSLELGWRDESRGSGIHSVGLETLLQHCSFLESLSIKGQESCLDSYAYAAIPRLASRTLKVLDLGYVIERNAKQLFSLTLDHIQLPQHMEQRTFQLQNLQKLSLILDSITDTFVLMISQNLPYLLELDLQDEPAEEPLLAFDLTTTGIQHLRACMKLQRLVLVRRQDVFPATFKRVEDLGFLLLAENCTNLESIKLGGFSRISDASCRQILLSSLNLHTFELLNSPWVTDLTFCDVSAIPIILVSVTLASCNLISDCSIRQLSFCKDLETLNLKGCKNVGDKGLEVIAGLGKLRTLNLNGLDISDEGLSRLGKGRTPLVFLSLRGCQRVSDTGIAALVDGPISQTLQSIDLSNISSLTDRAVLNLIRSGMRIVDMRLRDCCGVGDTSVIALASMTFNGCGFGGTLRLLDLWNCKGVTLLSLGWFKKPYFPRLRWLGLGWNSLSKSVLDSLSQERPHVHILDHGLELDGYDAEEVHELYQPCYEEEDELERWLDLVENSWR